MPTVLQSGPYRFFFYAGDRDEPPHVHFERNSSVSKFWMDPVRLANSGGFRRPELGSIQRLVEENQQELMRSWDEFFKD